VGSGVFPAAVPVDNPEREPVADDAGDEHNGFLAFVYADDGEQVRDAEKAEGDAEKQGPEPFHFEVAGDAHAQDYDAEDEVEQDYRVYIHFLAPLGGGGIYLTPCIPLSLRGVKGEGEDFFLERGFAPLKLPVFGKKD
jgi:hypothetical protein